MSVFRAPDNKWINLLKVICLKDFVEWQMGGQSCLALQGDGENVSLVGHQGVVDHVTRGLAFLPAEAYFWGTSTFFLPPGGNGSMIIIPTQCLRKLS